MRAVHSKRAMITWEDVMTIGTIRGNRALALAAVSLATFMTSLDNTVVNVALPSIQRDLRLSLGGLEWVASSYVQVGQPAAGRRPAGRPVRAAAAVPGRDGGVHRRLPGLRAGRRGGRAAGRPGPARGRGGAGDPDH